MTLHFNYNFTGSNKINMITLAKNLEWTTRKLWLYEHLVNWSVASYLFAEPIEPQTEGTYREKFLEKYRKWEHR